jgi:predicted secreted Zn-dependent protease
MSAVRPRQAFLWAAVALVVLPGIPSASPLISKSYSYFTIAGRTAEDLDNELSRRGPLTKSTGFRHPGATEIKFGGEITYLETDRRCSVGEVKVTLSTKIILPRWKNRSQANGSLGVIWDTLAADIKRHEERHAEIARTYARTLEAMLRDLAPASDCTQMEKRVSETTRRIVDDHDKEQLRFDIVESKNFDARMMRLLKNRAGLTD